MDECIRFDDVERLIYGPRIRMAYGVTTVVNTDCADISSLASAAPRAHSRVHAFRCHQVTLPSQAAALAAGSTQEGKGVGVGGDVAGSGRAGGGEGAGDGGLIAKKVARQMAERKKREGELALL